MVFEWLDTKAGKTAQRLRYDYEPQHTEHLPPTYSVDSPEGTCKSKQVTEAAFPTAIKVIAHDSNLRRAVSIALG